jgi:hypothetical protein
MQQTIDLIRLETEQLKAQRILILVTSRAVGKAILDVLNLLSPVFTECLPCKLVTELASLPATDPGVYVLVVGNTKNLTL